MTFKVGDMVRVIDGLMISGYPMAREGKVVDVFPELPNVVRVYFTNAGHLMVYVSRLEPTEPPKPQFKVGDTVKILFGDDYGEHAVIKAVSIQYGKWGYSLIGPKVNSWISSSYGDMTHRLELVILPDVVEALESLQDTHGKLCGARARMKIDDAKVLLKEALEEEKTRLAAQAETTEVH